MQSWRGSDDAGIQIQPPAAIVAGINMSEALHTAHTPPNASRYNGTTHGKQSESVKRLPTTGSEAMVMQAHAQREAECSEDIALPK